MMTRRPNVMIVISIVLAAVLTAVAGWVMAQMREDALASARAAAYNMALLFERDAARNLEIYELSLQAVIDALGDPRIAELPDDIRQNVLFDRSATAKHLGVILVANEAGDVIFDSRASPPREVNVADRDYFIVQRDTPNMGLYVSRPFIPRDGPANATIGLSRRLSKPDGTFAGVVVGTMRLDYFRQLMSGVEIGANGVVTLTLADGTLLMRRPYASEMIGKDFADSALFHRFEHDEAGGFFGVGPLDGVRRWFAFRRVEGYPLVFGVAVAAGDIYSEWRVRAWIIGSLTALLDASLITLALVLTRQLRRRELVEDELRALAGTDALTALANRRAFEARADHEWLRARRSAQPLAVMMIDVDRFKRFNDRYGHAAGDGALAAVARAIGAHARRPGDCAARYGGEEFVLLLPETSAAQALAHAERLRAAIEALAVPHEDSPNGVLTASVGVASTSERGFENWRALIEAADAALYTAKRAGRNRVAVWQPSVAREPQDAGPDL
ncbi:sensor domain-containing diguanylate cyclase [Paraburkholderia tropica]|jgi:diguanylate cyclase (GGDEF)-like protein|uniref:sensor domain-containing diguanylate cyclase n=1 Tax=Paraburkholderia tropica TaxID=92647 RepID=UPI00159065CA|nr:sensor domain-containing diguanylate cyclase [Paraburkholderia tropica]